MLYFYICYTRPDRDICSSAWPQQLSPSFDSLDVKWAVEHLLKSFLKYSFDVFDITILQVYLKFTQLVLKLQVIHFADYFLQVHYGVFV